VFLTVSRKSRVLILEKTISVLTIPPNSELGKSEIAEVPLFSLAPFWAVSRPPRESRQVIVRWCPHQSLSSGD
jgi:hypothetical protein